MERERAAMGELLIAERMDPRSPEVIERHGLLAALSEDDEDPLADSGIRRVSY